MLSIDSIVVSGGRPFYRFSNADGKTWLVPSKGLSTALQLYQPGGVKGKLLKTLFPVLHRFSPVRSLLHATLEKADLRSDIAAAATEAFGNRPLSFSIFGGTPSVHQKITVQFFSGQRIDGYCKLTDSPSVKALFIHEKSLLDHLHQAGLHDIPKCLGCSSLPDGTSYFIQSTVKSRRSFSPYRWTNLHEDFLKRMSAMTLTSVRFENSDLGESLLSLQKNLHKIPAVYHRQITSSLSRILEANLGHEVQYSAFHADFTPWNMFVEHGRLFVFDWEYGRLTYPPMLDRYHFFTQQALHVAHITPERIYSGLQRQPWFSPQDFTIYLLDIISRFTLREEGELPPAVIAMLRIWCDLLALADR